MKLKFKAELRDIIIFIIYSIFLLFLVAIAVVNVSSFASDAEFAGLNPIPAFTSSLFAPTMVFWLAGLIASFTGVSSYFFEREKGIGVQVGAKKEKGYSRWAEDKEIKKQLVKILPTEEKCEKVGIPLINNGKEIWVDPSGYHNMIIGSTGSGKSQSLSFPFIRVMAKGGESMIVTDPKGELYENTANELRERGYNIIILNFRDPQKGNCWNPFTLPYKLYKNGDIDKATELLEDLAKNILYDESSKGQDPFWENTSADYFTGLSLALFEDATEEEININSINIMSTVGEEKLGGTTYIKEYFSDKDQTGGAYVNASSTLMAPTDTKGSILSVFKQKIKMFSSRENLSEMLSHSDFDLEDIGRKKTAVFIVIQDEKKTYHPLVTIFLKQCYETLVRVAQETGGKLKYRTNFLLDEFANMPPLTDVDAMVSAARSRNIKLSFIIQNFSQLNDVYGKEKAETIRGNCGNTIYLLSTELAALEEISKMCGEVKSKKDDKTASTPLVTVSDLQKMKQFEVIIMRLRLNPFKTKFIPYYKWNIKRYPKAAYPQREKDEVHVFDLREFVKKKKKEKLMEMMNSGTSPMGGMPGGMAAGLPGMGAMPSSMFEPSPMSRPNPMVSESPFAQSSQAPSSGLDVDDLIKKIDAKIAEIEAEEKKQAEEEKKNKPAPQVSRVDEVPSLIDLGKPEDVADDIKEAVVEDIKPLIDRDEIKREIKNELKEEIKEEIKPNFDDDLFTLDEDIDDIVEEPVVVSRPVEKPIIYEDKIPTNNSISDDQFFDDFFDD